MNSSTKLTRSPDVLETTVNDESILLHSVRWQYLHFTGSGAAIWQTLDAPITFGALIEKLQQRFEVDEQTCRLDTERILKRLIEEEFLIES